MIPGSGRSSEEGNGNAFQYSCLGNLMDRGAWWAAVHGVTRVRNIVVQLLSHVRHFVTPWTRACQASLFFTISQSLLKFISIELMTLSNHFILCCPFLPPALNFSQHQVHSSKSTLCISRPKYWSISINPSDEYSELISFMIDWLDLLPIQGTLNKVSFSTTVQKHQFFGAQLS